MQMQLQYHLYEDRLLLLLADEGVSWGWWITRRGLRMLAVALMARIEASIDPGTEDGVRDFVMAARRNEAAASTPIVDEASETPDRYSLLVSVRHGPGEDGNHLLILVDKAGEEQGIQCTGESLFAFLELFRRQLDRTDWDTPLSWPEPGLDARGASAALQ